MLSLVVIAVGITTFSVAWVAHSLVPDMPWAAAIALGAIVAPPDAAAASAILRQLHIPHRMVVILEGESLLNDATALLVYRLAVTATMGSTFSTSVVAWQALAMVGSVVAGFVLAHCYVRIVDRITDIPSSIIISQCRATPNSPMVPKPSTPRAIACAPASSRHSARRWCAYAAPRRSVMTPFIASRSGSTARK